MNDSSTNSELHDLKVKIKKWEKCFFKKEGRKANKSDIDGNEEVCGVYKRYWSLVKLQSSFKETKSTSNKRSKQPLREVTAKNYSSSQYTNKLLKHYVTENIDVKSSFSLKRKPKPKPSEESKNKENEAESETVVDVSFVEIEETEVIKDSLQDEISQIVEDSGLWSLPEDAVVVTDLESTNDAENTSISFDKDQVILETAVDETVFESFKEQRLKDATSDNNSCDSSDLNNKEPETATSLLSSMLFGSSELKDSDYCTFESSTAVDSIFDIYEFRDDSENKEQNTTVTNKRKHGNKTTGQSRPVKKSKRELTTEASDNEAISKPKPKKRSVKESKEELKEDSSGIEVKPKPKRRKAAPKANFQKLNLKKKVYASRGYKKFNHKRYKYAKWKKLKKNRCFKCGDPDHWAMDCPNKDIIDELNNEECNYKKDFTSSLNNEDDSPLIIIPGRPVFEENSDCEEVLNDALFALGFKTFKKNQQETIKRICCGQSTILVSPTGSGKSLCYQIPAYLYWKYRKCITIVVSPLISLMEDQLACLPKCLKAVSIHSGLKPQERQLKLSMVQEGNAQIVFLSPEMVGNSFFDFSLFPSIGFACIDEAHCLSEWSNNFRPSYLQLYKVMKEKLQVKTFLALTATATKDTISQITKNLELSSDSVVGDTTVPQNLNLTVSRDIDKDHALVELLKSDRYIKKKSIIIYCTRREVTEKVATFIRIEMQNVTFKTKSGAEKKYDARAYHAGLTSDERSRIQKRFLKGDLRIVVATIAFGMGINKSDVEGVIHYNLPRSFESYVQEIGRAGRNGDIAECHLFLDSNGTDLYELRKHIYANSMDKRVLRKLVEKVFKKCKCNQLNSTETNGTTDAHDSRCEGHEVAFPIKNTISELDVTEETILTLLCFLQLNYTKFNIELLPHMYSVCKILCYRDGGKQMDAVAKRCPPLSVALTLHKKENKLSETPAMFSFPFVEVASMLGRSSSEIRKQLRQLQWEPNEEGKMRHTNVRLLFESLSFHLKAPGDLSDSEFEDVLDFLYNYITSHEEKELQRLINVYETFREFSSAKVSKSVDLVKSEKLKEVVNNYFIGDEKCDTDSESITSSQLQRWLGSSNTDRFDVQSLLSVDNSDIENARCDIRDLITIHSDQQFTARSIARILQGIGSPKYPIEVWGKVRRFWRVYIHMDFNSLLKIANEELVRLKTEF
ncbi:ATP-dependent DNA helicase Q4-like protein [Leptotrombidium deliense]|uniref:DNA 3'-5' helicase n=1 Tax=Leptotrombidium deliense TaxID=299467 RepID=A0A443SL42_9ACAR|nr:ATP-dependent DNA helicase Q4-like protein [Leptotrombidium deliense]